MNHRDRALALLRQMTIDEKIAQLYSAWLNIDSDGSFTVKSIIGSEGEKPGTPESVLKNGIGQITRPFGTRPSEPKACAAGVNHLQHYLVHNTRLGIPALLHEECLAGLMAKGATQFPAAVNYGSTWDPEIIEQAARVIGDELYSIGGRQGLAPVLDVSRDARWGRTDESPGEDPYLVGSIASAYVKGLQGKDRRILATLKHFVGHSFGEGGRNHAPVRIGMRELNDIFVLPFEMAVKQANPGGLMPAYHDIDGEPCTASAYFITELLRRRWGFDGLVVADYEAISQLHYDHRVARDLTEASALALKAGMDVELPGFTSYAVGLKDALDKGLVEIEDIDAAVVRGLIEKSRLGIFENPYIDTDKISLNTADNRKTAKETAAKSIVLLKNDGILPLKDEGTIAVIGPLADEPYAGYCGYSFPAHIIGAYPPEETVPRYSKTLRKALESATTRAQIVYDEGCKLIIKRAAQAIVFPGDVQPQTTLNKAVLSTDTSTISHAVQTARSADCVVAVLGDVSGLFQNGTVGEGSDVTSLKLPGVQQELLDQLLDTGKPVIVVLMNGRPYDLGRGFNEAAAIIEAWLPGESAGEVVAETLLGKICPGGKLPISYSTNAGVMPYFYNHKLKSAGVAPQSEFGCEFPFGFGLSYTRFEFSDFAIENDTVATDGEIRVSCVVRNTGEYTGDETAQLYIRHLYSGLVRPVKELKGFQRIQLQPGKSAAVNFELPVDMLGMTVADMRREVAAGQVEIMLGSSSDDIHFRTTVTITGPTRSLPEDWRMRTHTEVVHTS